MTYKNNHNHNNDHDNEETASSHQEGYGERVKLVSSSLLSTNKQDFNSTSPNNYNNNNEGLETSNSVITIPLRHHNCQKVGVNPPSPLINISDVALAADGIEETRVIHTYSNNGKQLGPYTMISQLGSGSFSTVKIAIDNRTNKKVALKIMDKDMFRKSERMQVCIRREIEICIMVKHPNIVGYIETFETLNQLVLVLEYIDGGELFDYVVDGKCTLEDARNIFHDLARAVSYLHSKHICHRDLKLENVLVDKEKKVHLADFGLARFFEPETLLTTRCGSEDYSAPEIVRKLPYNPVLTDSWALGVILFTMLTGELPFIPSPGGSIKQMNHLIANGDYSWPENVNVPDDAKDLVRGLLKKDPAERMTATDVLSHPWLTNTTNEMQETKCDAMSRNIPSDEDLNIQKMQSLAEFDYDCTKLSLVSDTKMR